MERKSVVCLYGPTAAGKTDVAVALARRYPVQLISVDSALVYREMDIGTAKPDTATLEKAPHRLIDILDPAESYSAARFCEDALVCINEAIDAGKLPLLVGGTMLYFRALLDGISDLPSADMEIRKRLEAEALAQGWPGLHARLGLVDPVAAARIHRNDPQRITRALEVYELTGKPLSSFHGVLSPPLGASFDVLRVGLMPEDRAALHERISHRFEIMMAAGFMQEMEALRARGDLNLQMPSMRCVGYRQAWECLDGLYSEAEMLDKAKAATRQLAKRQMTWMRSTPTDLMLDPLQSGCENLADTVGGVFESRFAI